jgi:hypothetical protein
MPRNFDIRREGQWPGTPQDAFDAVTTGTGGWLWPVEYEPRTGGKGPFDGIVTEWDPPHHLITRVEGEDGLFNQLEYILEARDGGTTYWRYSHSGIFVDDWDNQFDGAAQHTDFYMHTLGQYLRYFSRRPVKYAEYEGPQTSKRADAFTHLRAKLGLENANQDDVVTIDVPGIDAFAATVDYLHPHFIGLRTDDAMYRFFGRNAFDYTVGFTLHLFGADADAAKSELVWHEWLDGIYA